MNNRLAQIFARTALASLILAPLLAEGAEGGMESSDIVIHKRAMFQLGFERIKLSSNEMMGMVGATYLIETMPNLYIGPAAYGAITGQRGGFFTAGGEAAWQHRLNPNTNLQAGIFVGGGGGSSASMVGGGLMVRPHVDLLWKIGDYRAGISASQVSFPNGTVSSHQIGVVALADSKFAYVLPEHAGRRMDASGRYGAGFDRLMATVGRYKPRRGTENLSGIPDTGPIGYAGVRIERLLSPKLYWGIEAAGASNGNAAGYAEFLGTLGAETLLGNGLFGLGARVALGMGGGGQVSVGGGQLKKVGAYASVNLSRDTHLALEGGYATAPKGKFNADYGSVNFVWDLDHPGATGRNATIAGFDWAIGTAHYMDAAYKDGSKKELDAVTIKLNRYLNDSFYLTGQAQSAYSGVSGGYSVGLFGAGCRSKKFDQRFLVGTEMLIGAAGGGSIDTSGGAVMQPMVYIGMDISKVVGVKLGTGRIKSFKGALNSRVAELSLSFSFGAAGR